jgi:hypothetical protein
MQPIYTNTARFDTGRALTDDELFKLAPSVFATQAHESRSERFRPIPTIDVLRSLEKEGFGVVGARQCTVRDPGKAPFTKHLLRIRRMSDERKYAVGDTVFEMLMRNANDGSGAYDLLGSLYRIRCMNSMTAKLADVESVRVRHSGDVQSKVIDGTFRVLESAELALTAPEKWSQIKLEKEEALALATSAHQVRFGEKSAGQPISPQRLLQARRSGDCSNDLWTTFNVIQENCIRGGQRSIVVTEDGRYRNVSTRAIRGIDQDLKINRALWMLTDRMAEIKGTRLVA